MRDLEGVNQLTFRDFERDLHDRTPRTLQSYREAACQLAGHHGGADLLALTKDQVLAYLIGVRKTHSPATELVRFRSLRRFYNWAVKEDLIDRSPLHGVETRSLESKEIPILDVDDLRAAQDLRRQGPRRAARHRGHPVVLRARRAAARRDGRDPCRAARHGAGSADRPREGLQVADGPVRQRDRQGPDPVPARPLRAPPGPTAAALARRPRPGPPRQRDSPDDRARCQEARDRQDPSASAAAL